jgi:hypothetical protein
MPATARRTRALRAATAASSRRPGTLRGRGRRREAGQGIVEFALIIPLFLILLMAVIEFGFYFNSFLSANYTTKNAALVAAEAGNKGEADCVILNQIDDDTTAPNADAQIREVRVFRAAPDGTPRAGEVNTYTRGGSFTCYRQDGSAIIVPYTQTTSGYPADDRCNEIVRYSTSGTVIYPCPALTPARTDVDTVGVAVDYAYQAHTPMSLPFLGMLLELRNGEYLVTKSNVMRMEPVL